MKSKKDNKGSGLVSLIGVSMIVVITATAITASSTLSTKRVGSALAQQQSEESARIGFNAFELTLEALAVGHESFMGPNRQFNDEELGVHYSSSVYHSSAVNIQRPTNLNNANDEDPLPKWRADNKVEAGWPGPADKWVIIESEGFGLHDKKSKLLAIYEWRDADSAVSPYALAAKNVLLKDSEVDTSSGVTGKASVMSTDGYLGCDASGPSIIKGDVKKSTPGSSSYLDGCTVDGNVYSKDLIKAKDNIITGKFFSNISNQDDQRSNLKDAEEKFVDARGSSNHPGAPTLDSWSPTLYGYSPILTETDSPSPGKPKVKKLIAEQCGNKTTLPQLIKEQTEPTILDATSCSSLNGLFSPRDSKVELNSDVAIIMDNTPSIKDFKISSADGNHHSLTIATRASSESTDSVPSDSSVGKLTVSNVQTQPGVSIMLYSRDQVEIKDNSEITGQAMAGTTLNFTNSKLHYHPVKLLGTTKVVSPKNGAPGLIRVY